MTCGTLIRMRDGRKVIYAKPNDNKTFWGYFANGYDLLKFAYEDIQR